MTEDIDLKGKVVAVFDSPEATDGAVTELRREGFEVEVLRGEEGRRRLDPHGGQGILRSLEHAVSSLFGDEDRILDEVDTHLAEDRSFVVVDVDDHEDSAAADILKHHGGHYMWRFGQWTYVPVGGH